MNSSRLVALCLVIALAFVRAEDPAGDAAAAGGCTFENILPWTYEAELDFNLDSYNHQQGIFAVTTDCKIPAAEEGALTSTMTCTGSLPSDCDTYSQAFAYSIAAGEKFGAIFLHMDEATAKGHIAYAFFWSIIGTICTWLGLILLLYSEIKAVTVFREQDERDRLVSINILVRNNAKYTELEEADDQNLAPRPYITAIGGIIFFIGMFCTWLPLCDVIGIIFPAFSFATGLLCIAFVFTGAFLLSLTAALFIVGLCWSCTRGWAALVLIVLSLVGNVMLFGGIIGLVIYLALLGASLYAYFVWAPSYYNEKKETKPFWLQSLGKENFYHVDLDAERFKENMEKGAKGMAAESRAIIAGLPLGKQALEATDKAKELAEEQAAKAKAFADEQAEKVKQAAAGEKKAEPQSGTV
eukprot:CAMPEP_0172171682 /NCGR_PEP_ID=MMETSP1050-20130122/12027_1 /TAXON_ID=233186 /ORGANISM="Cryptomonas curvata, Strain CCAP979/52" /LENGTH=411 /DNA_ID=CAMNT_0012843139 /DNA_START=371 /DNA_END=1606 /DNA_ORIENTATION=-